jgi:uncharacterized protein (TIGR02118 family)
MHRLVALWTKPEDVEGFEREYHDVHMALVHPLPGLAGAVSARAKNGPYYRVADLSFASMDDFQAAMGSEQGKALLADANRLQERFGVRLDTMGVEED